MRVPGASRVEETRQLARLETLKAQEKDKARYDSKHEAMDYNVGYLVWIFIPIRKVGLSEKLMKSAIAKGSTTKVKPNGLMARPGPFEEQFKLFAKFGDGYHEGGTITLSNSDRWMRQAKVIDGKNLTTADTSVYYKKIARTKKSLTIDEFRLYLEHIAKSKNLKYEDIVSKLANCGKPETTNTTHVENLDVVKRLTDPGRQKMEQCERSSE
ncbi:TPPP [Cordylochernes scorpioides]|uniref:TPPP n=1 Tax=Cordylochernes scorpioides TaxID=51811 RepID=A0ABY6LR23_9ARAC|nr:TPPP [Cordylochernes scorpioides]